MSTPMVMELAVMPGESQLAAEAVEELLLPLVELFEEPQAARPITRVEPAMASVKPFFLRCRLGGSWNGTCMTMLLLVANLRLDRRDERARAGGPPNCRAGAHDDMYYIHRYSQWQLTRGKTRRGALYEPGLPRDLHRQSPHRGS